MFIAVKTITIFTTFNYFLSFYSLLQSEAQELTIVKMSKFGGGIGAPSKEERLKAAAEIHLRLGQIQRYCELMVELGEVRFHRISSTSNCKMPQKLDFRSFNLNCNTISWYSWCLYW